MTSGSGNSQSEQLQLNLLDNALDSLLSAAEAVQRDEGPRSLKETVLHLGNGIELLIKARLAREHWSLIFSNTDQASYDKLADAEFTSVDFPKAIARLEQIAKVSVDKAIISHIDSIRKLRNRLTHYTATLDSAQTKSLVAKGMTFSVEFCEQQKMVTPDTEGKLGEIHLNLTKLQEFVNDRLKSISGTHANEWKYALIWECPECWQQTLVIDGGEVDCKFCMQRANPNELAETSAEGQIGDCPECGEESTFAFVIYNNDHGEWVCFSCGVRGENYDNCFRCDQLTSTHEVGDVVFCENCSLDIFNRE